MRLAERRQHPATLRRHLLMREEVLVATRAHWASLIEPAVTACLAFLVVSWVSTVAKGEAGFHVSQVLWWAWLLLVARFLWKVAEWSTEWFAVTDKRLLKTFGLFTRNVAMMPLRKVTDMNYTRSPAGRILGYGRFELESAGQDQAMREINWLPDPDEIYQRVGDAVFGPAGVDPDEDLPDGGAAHHLDVPDDPYDVEVAPVDAFDPLPDRPVHPDDEPDDEPHYEPHGEPDHDEPDDADEPDDEDDPGYGDGSEPPDDGDESTAWQVSRDEPARRVDAYGDDDEPQGTGR